jgi:HK97 family phage major capsid protein
MLTQPVSRLPYGTTFSRFLAAYVAAKGDLYRAKGFASEWRNSPLVAAAFDELLTKAAIGPGTTTDPAWAGPLVAPTGVASEALGLLNGLSIFGALAPQMRPTPFGLVVPRDDTSTALAGWAAEGAPLVAASLTFAPLGPLARTKIGAATAVTKELATSNDDAAMATVRTSILGRLARAIDLMLLDPTVAAAPGVPASITNGATAIVSSGSTAAAMQNDFGAMLAAITSAGGALTWIMPKTTMGRIAGALGVMSGLPTRLFGFPVVASKNSPPQVTLVDLDAILLADDGQFEVSQSQNFSQQQNTTPDNPATSATVFVSGWQDNLISIRTVRWINWLRATPGAVVYMTVAY